MGTALSTAPERVRIQPRSTKESVLVIAPAAQRVFTPYGALHAEAGDGGVTVADPYDIAWGSGADVTAAVRDWEIAARDVLALLSTSDLAPLMARRLEILRRWFC